MTVREPLGVVGAIIPWNVPMLLMALKVAPALVAGNTVVVKSAEEAPLAVLRICELLNRMLPPGCFNMLSGFGPECGAPLVEHPKVRKVTFTGSVEVGRIVGQAAAEKLIPVTLELGGKRPMIVFADCDFEKTVTGAITSMRFTRQGQSCTAASRIYVERPIFDRFVDALAAQVDAMVMGDPLDEKTDIGTIISQDQFEKVQGFIEEGMRHRGRRPAAPASAMPNDPALKKGLFIQPHIFTGLPQRQPAGAGGDLRPGDLRVPVRRRRRRCWRRRTAANTASPPRSGPTTSRSGSTSRTGWKPGWCRSTRTSSCRPTCPMAA